MRIQVRIYSYFVEHFKCREQMIILVCKVLALLVSNSVAHKTLRNAVDMCVPSRSYHQDGGTCVVVISV